MPTGSHLPLQVQSISIETAVFIATNHEKTNMAVIEIGKIISFVLNFLPEI